MKLETGRIDRFLSDPGAARCVLLYGDDVGLIRERALHLRHAIIGASGDDAFQVTELDRATISDLASELAAVPLLGGRRVVHLRDAGDFAVDAVRRALGARGEGIAILEGADLPSRSKLRALIEASAEAIAIGCYAENARSLQTTITETLRRFDISADLDTLGWLAGQLGADRAMTRREIEKLALFVGDGGQVDLRSAIACVGDGAGMVVEDALYAAMLGEAAMADRACQVALAEGVSPVQILRSALSHVQRLGRVRAAIDAGRSVSDATAALRPPLFRPRQARFEQALRRWSTSALASAATRLFDLECKSKQGMILPDQLARFAIIGLAQRGAVLRR